MCKKTIVLSVLSILLLGACSRRSDVEAVPLGPITATGTLVSADVSLIRRGSHILIVDGQPRYYVESKTENLGDFEGRLVGIDGTIELNTMKGDFPVIVLRTIRSKVGNEGLHLWNIPALNLRLRTPDAWKGSIQGKTASFTLDGEDVPLLSIQLMSGSTLPTGESFYVRNRPAVRTELNSGASQEIFVLERDTVISFRFDPSSLKTVRSTEEGKILAAEFERLLSELSFLSDTKLKTSVTGSGSGIACGGPAGVLCSSGYYCDISNTTDALGVCKKR